MLPKSFVAICMLSLIQPVMAAERGYLGVSFENLPGPENGVQTGVIVRKVFAGMAAEHSGLKRGEIVTQINGVTVPDRETAVGLLAENTAGERVRLTVMDRTASGLRPTYVFVTLGNHPSSEFAKIMTANPPCRLTSSSRAAHCSPQSKQGRQPALTDTVR